MKLDQILKLAQRDANRDGRTMVVLNLNPYAPLYVIRTWHPNMKDVVAKVDPQDCLANA